MSYSEITLPEGVSDGVLNRSQLAMALGRTEPTIDKYVSQGMPVSQKGGNGKAYEFRLLDCWRWLVSKEREEQSRDEEAQTIVEQMRLALVGGESVRGRDAALSPKEQRETYDAERTFMLTAQMRRSLVKATDVTEMMTSVFLVIRDAMTSIPDRLEREAGVEGKALEVVQRVTDSALVEMQDRVARASGVEVKEAAE